MAEKIIAYFASNNQPGQEPGRRRGKKGKEPKRVSGKKTEERMAPDTKLFEEGLKGLEKFDDGFRKMARRTIERLDDHAENYEPIDIDAELPDEEELDEELQDKKSIEAFRKKQREQLVTNLAEELFKHIEYLEDLDSRILHSARVVEPFQEPAEWADLPEQERESRQISAKRERENKGASLYEPQPKEKKKKSSKELLGVLWDDPVLFLQEFESETVEEKLLRKHREERKDVLERIGKLAATPEIRDKYGDEFETRVESIIRAHRVEKYDLARLAIDKQVIDITIGPVLEHRDFTETEKEEIEDLRKAQRAIELRRMMLLNEENTHFQYANRRNIEYRRQFLQQNFVETPSVQRMMHWVYKLAEQGEHMILHGPPGAGKTELARAVSRFMMGKEPLVHSGSEEASLHHILGHYVLKSGADLVTDQDFMDAAFAIKNDLKGDQTSIEQIMALLRIVSSSGTKGVFNTGPLVDSFDEGKMLILDEYNRNPKTFRNRMQDPLTRRFGENLEVPEGKMRVKRKKGQVMVATMNIGERFKADTLDPSEQRRWTAIRVHFHPAEEQLQIIAAAISNKRGECGLTDPQWDAMEALSMAASEMQAIFDGRFVDIYGPDSDPAKSRRAKKKSRSNFKESVLDLRRLIQIVKDEWKGTGFRLPESAKYLNPEAREWDSAGKESDEGSVALNFHIHEFLNKVVNDKDRAYMVRIFLRYGLFKGWTENDFDFPLVTDDQLENWRTEKNMLTVAAQEGAKMEDADEDEEEE